MKLISAEELVYAPSFHCGFQNGKAFFSITLNNGFVFSNHTVATVINRIQYLPLDHVQRFKTEDQEYVRSELTAIFVFLFSILPNILFNPTTPAGLCGRRRSSLEWMLLARQAGFQIPEILYQNKVLQSFDEAHAGTMQCILYFNNKCYSSALATAPRAEACCLALGNLSGESILEIWLNMEDEQPLFIMAQTQPGFKNATPDFINDVNQLL